MGALQAFMCTFLIFKFPGTELARAKLYPILQGVAELWSWLTSIKILRPTRSSTAT